MVSLANRYPLKGIPHRDFAAIRDKTRFVDMPIFGRKLGKNPNSTMSTSKLAKSG
jgi:hypothetical protein